MKTAIYLRKSRAEEINDTIEETLARHKDTLLTFARNNMLSVIKIYEEVVSGESLVTRPQMLQLLSDADTGQYQAILCMDIDRLGRGTMSDQGIILETLKNNDVKIITPRKIYDLNNELDEEYTEFETFIARRELKLIKRRMQRGIRKTIEEGGYVANAPYGYEKIEINKCPTLAIVESEAAYVSLIFDMYVHQGLGCQLIADTLNSMGAKPRRSDTFCRTSVRHILNNNVYIGKIVWDKKKHIRKGIQGNEKNVVIYNPKENWNVYNGIHPPIIDEVLFNQAQEILHGRYHPPYNKGVVENPLAGILICKQCGNLIQRRPYYDRKQPDYLICETRGCCQSTRLDRVEESLLTGIDEQLAHAKIKYGNTVQDTHDIEKALEQIKKQIATVVAQKDKLHDLLEQGVYDIETFVSRSESLEKKLASLFESREMTENRLDKMLSTNIKESIKRIEDALNAYGSANAQKRNILLKSILKEVHYYKQKGWKPNQFELNIVLKDF